MKIIDRLNNFKYMSDNIRLYIGRMIATLNQLDMLENETPTTDEATEEHERKTDNLMVDMFEFIQWIGVNFNQIDYGCEYSLLEKELENELINDFTVSTDILKRKLQRIMDIVRDSMWPFVWDEYLKFTHSLINGELKNRIKHHLLKAPSMTEFWERMEWSNDYPFIINGKPLDESRSEQIARDWVWRLEHYFRQGFLCQQAMMDKIEEADKVLNPQPDTSTEQEQTVKRSPIAEEKGIKVAFDLAEKKGLMRLEGVYYRWLADNALLAYFCERLYNLFLSMTKGNKSWGYFSNWFIVKGKDGKDIIPNGAKLNRYKTDWKADRLLDSEDPFCPDGDKIIDEIILSAKK